jgi:hypothetical protein
MARGDRSAPFEAKNDYEFLYLLAQKLGYAEQMFKNIKVENNIPDAADILREINRGGWSTGYCGQSPERLQAHMRNQGKFDLVTLRAPKDDPEVGGDYYGLPWPCWGKPELRHPGSPILYRTDVHVMEGGGHLPARFGTERNGQTLLAENSFKFGPISRTGYPEFSMAVLKKLGWDKDLTPEELATIEKIGGDKVDTVSWSLTCRAASSASACSRRHALWQRQGPGGGLEPAGSRALPTVSRSTRRGRNSFPSTRRGRTSGSSGCSTPASASRRRRLTTGLPKSSPSSYRPGGWWNMRAAATRRAPIAGLRNCSRTCSSK